VNARDAHGATLLHETIENRRLNIVNVLFDTRTIEINAQDKYGATPLHKVIECHLPVDVVRLILEWGGCEDMETPANNRITPVDIVYTGIGGKRSIQIQIKRRRVNRKVRKRILHLLSKCI